MVIDIVILVGTAIILSEIMKNEETFVRFDLGDFFHELVAYNNFQMMLSSFVLLTNTLILYPRTACFKKNLISTVKRCNVAFQIVNCVLLEFLAIQIEFICQDLEDRMQEHL